jgi:hypothetical protein
MNPIGSHGGYRVVQYHNTNYIAEDRNKNIIIITRLKKRDEQNAVQELPRSSNAEQLYRTKQALLQWDVVEVGRISFEMETPH